MRPSELPETDQILLGENLELLPSFGDRSFQLVYIDPPFNTGKVQQRRTVKTVRDVDGDRTGFQGRRYATTEVSRHGGLAICAPIAPFAGRPAPQTAAAFLALGLSLLLLLVEPDRRFRLAEFLALLAGAIPVTWLRRRLRARRRGRS